MVIFHSYVGLPEGKPSLEILFYFFLGTSTNVVGDVSSTFANAGARMED